MRDWQSRERPIRGLDLESDGLRHASGEDEI